MLGILSVAPDSPASAAGLKTTDRLVSCNGHPLDDWIDFLYCANEPLIYLEYRRGPLTRKLSLRRNPGTDWGLTFLGQEPSSCRKKCIFCFVDQLPDGVRKSLLVKDDDVRYSFVQGTYVTLDREDTEYAIRKHLSPLHISVHSTDPFIRGKILGTGREEPVLPMLEKLSEAGISMETQIVIVPGYNDKEKLDETLASLLAIPGVISAGVVPVGLTKYRDGLPEIRRPDETEARNVVRQCNTWREKALDIRGYGWVYPSDELFIMASLEIPPVSYYDNCALRENGIGLLADLLKHRGIKFRGSGVILTGTSAAPYLKLVLENSSYEVIAVENSFLGPQVSVAGLLSGADIVRSVRKLPDIYNSIVLPGIMFNHEMYTLDDFTPDDISRSTGREIVIASNLEELV